MRLVRVRATDADETRPPLMEQVYAAEVAAGGASAALQRLNILYPLPERMSHVKRIWRQPAGPERFRLLLLLSPIAGELNGEEWRGVVERALCTKLGNVSIEQVPRRMPGSREEYQRWREAELWPTSFHENRSVLQEEQEEAALVERIGARVLGKIAQCRVPTVVVVDPQNTHEDEWAWGVQGGTALEEPVFAAISAVAQKQRSLHEQPVGRDAPYLCTGFLAYCTDEPSIMSAMALVHSRIRAVVFLRSDDWRGGVFSRLRLQDVRETNHHFSVFRPL